MDLQTILSAAPMFGQALSGSNPAIVINNGAMQPQGAGYGSPDDLEEYDDIPNYGAPDSLDFIDGELDGVEVAYGESELSVDSSAFSAFSDELTNGAAYGSPDDFGGLFTRVRNAARSASGKTGEVVNKIVGKVNRLVTKTNSHDRQLKSMHRGMKAIKRRVQVDGRKGRMAYNVVQKEFGKKNQLQRALLSAAQAVPGNRALGLFESEQFQDVLDSLKTIGEGVKDWKFQTEDTPYTLSAVSGTPTTAENQVNIQEIAAAVEDFRKDLNSLREFMLDAKLAASAADLEEIKQASILTTVAKLTPSQITRRDEAWYESVFKYVAGTPGALGGILGGITV